jgi:hypothetical protein
VGEGEKKKKISLSLSPGEIRRYIKMEIEGKTLCVGGGLINTLHTHTHNHTHLILDIYIIESLSAKYSELKKEMRRKENVSDAI